VASKPNFGMNLPTKVVCSALELAALGPQRTAKTNSVSANETQFTLLCLSKALLLSLSLAQSKSSCRSKDSSRLFGCY